MHAALLGSGCVATQILKSIVEFEKHIIQPYAQRKAILRAETSHAILLFTYHR